MARDGQGYLCGWHDKMMMMYGFKYSYLIQIICTQLYGFVVRGQMLACQNDTESCICWLAAEKSSRNRTERQFFLSTYVFLALANFCLHWIHLGAGWPVSRDKWMSVQDDDSLLESMLMLTAVSVAKNPPTPCWHKWWWKPSSVKITYGESITCIFYLFVVCVYLRLRYGLLQVSSIFI